MLINLITDSPTQRPGFEARYRALPVITGIIRAFPHIVLHVAIFFLKYLKDKVDKNVPRNTGPLTGGVTIYNKDISK